MVTRRMESPQTIFDPKRCVRQRIVLIRGADPNPDVRRPIGRLHEPVVRHVIVVVPDEFAPKRGKIGDEDHPKQGGGEFSRGYLERQRRSFHDGVEYTRGRAPSSRRTSLASSVENVA